VGREGRHRLADVELPGERGLGEPRSARRCTRPGGRRLARRRQDLRSGDPQCEKRHA